MTNNADNLFQQMRVGNLKGFENFVFEVDIADEKISKSPCLGSDNNDFKQLQARLPPSFRKFISEVANGFHLEVGNALTIFPVGQRIDDYWTDVLSLTIETLSDSLFPSKDFVFFGMSGVDSEMFAFYTATRFDNGEYPIVWSTPGSVDTNPFVLVNTGFDKFLTMQYYMLKATEYEETYATYEEAVKTSSDKNKIEQDEKNWQNFQDKLYDTFDPKVPKPNQDFYKSATTLTGLNETIERTKLRNAV